MTYFLLVGLIFCLFLILKWLLEEFFTLIPLNTLRHDEFEMLARYQPTEWKHKIQDAKGLTLREIKKAQKAQREGIQANGRLKIVVESEED